MGHVFSHPENALTPAREVHRSLDGITAYLLILLKEDESEESYSTALVSLPASNAPDFIKHYGGKPVDLTEETVVLWQGKGDYPPADVRTWMNERFGITL